MRTSTNLDLMPFRRRMSLRPINRIKHVIDFQGGVTLGVQTQRTLVNTVASPALSAQEEVEFGSKINGIYLKAEVSATSGTALANVYMMIFKNPGGNLTLPNANSVGNNDNKKFSIHQEMIMLQKFDADVSPNPRVLFNGVVRIPRGYQRNGPNDLLQIAVFSPGANLDLCFQCHYKEFR